MKQNKGIRNSRLMKMNSRTQINTLLRKPQNNLWEQAMRFNNHSASPVGAPFVVEPSFDNRMVTYGQVAGHPLINLLNRIIPPGYGTYVVVLVWVAVNVASVFGYSIPGFEVTTGNEGALSLVGLALAYFRRAIGK